MSERETLTFNGVSYRIARTKQQAIEDYNSQGRVYIANGCLSGTEMDDLVDTLWPKKMNDTHKYPLTTNECFKPILNGK